MGPDEYLREGDLRGALEKLQDQVRVDPSNAKLRVFLFQLLCVAGEWPRALNQLEVAGELDAGALAMLQMYSKAIHCEVFRSRVFKGERSPLLFGQPEEWIALLMEAVKAGCEGRHDAAAELRARAYEDAPTTSGTMYVESSDGAGAEGFPFEWIADGDSRLGPILEAVVNGFYYWVPFTRIHKIHVERPNDLRDLVWMPVHFTWSNGGETVGLIPTRYPGSESAADDLFRLSRKTAWESAGEGNYVGIGQRMMATDAVEFPVMDIRQIVLDTLEASSTEEPAHAAKEA